MSSETIVELSRDNFRSHTSDGVVLVDFWAPWCAPCVMQTPVLERVAEKASGRFKIAKLNVDEAPSVASEFGISGIPALLVFKDGEVVSHLVGLQSEEALLSALERAA